MKNREIKKTDEWIITDSCSFEKARRYPNPDKDRNPHFATIVHLKTGTVVELKSGSIIRVIKQAK